MNYKRELEIMQERKDLKREKALVEVERTYQAKLQAQNDKCNDKVDEMHAENERIRQNYESGLEAFNKDNKKIGGCVPIEYEEYIIRFLHLTFPKRE